MHRPQFKCCNWSWRCCHWKLSSNCISCSGKAVLPWMEIWTTHHHDCQRYDFCVAGIQLPTPSWGYCASSLESLVGLHHNSAPGLERFGSSFTSATSVPISLSFLLLGYPQPVGSSLRQVAAFCNSPSPGKCSHPCPDIRKCRLLRWSLSSHFSPLYSCSGRHRQ